MHLITCFIRIIGYISDTCRRLNQIINILHLHTKLKIMKTLLLLTFAIFPFLAWSTGDRHTTELATPMDTTNWAIELGDEIPQNNIESFYVTIDGSTVEKSKIAAFVVNQKRSEGEGSVTEVNSLYVAELKIHVNPLDTVHFYFFDNADGEKKVYPAKEALVYNSDSTYNIINYYNRSQVPNGLGMTVGDALVLTKSDKPIVIVVGDTICSGDTNGKANLYIFGRGTSYTYEYNNTNTMGTEGLNTDGTVSTTTPIEILDLESDTLGIKVTVNEDLTKAVTRSVIIDTYQIPDLEYRHVYDDCDGNGILSIDNFSNDITYTINGTKITNGSFQFQSPPPTQISLTYGDGCNTDLELNIPIYEKVTLDVPNNVNLACYGDVASITLDALGGTGSFMYSIDNGSTFYSENTFTIDAASNIMAVIRDIDGCSSDTIDVEVIVSQSSPLTLNPIPSSLNITCTTIDIELTANGGGENVDYMYKIQKNNDGTVDTTITLSSTSSVSYPLSAGTYDIWVIDNDNCSTEPQTVTVNPVDNPLKIINLDDLNNITIPCNGDGTNITVNATGGAGGYKYKIDDMGYIVNNTFNVTAGSHMIYVKDSSDCEIWYVINIGETSQSLTIDIIGDLYVSCHDESIEVTFKAGGGTNEGYEYSVNGGDFTDNSTFTLKAGTHDVVLRDNSGCQMPKQDFTITEPPTPLFLGLPDNGIVQIPCHNGTTDVELIADGGTGIGYLYTIGTITQPTPNFTGLSAGTYQVSVRDNSGCETGPKMLILNEPDEPLSITFEVNNSCKDDASGSIQTKVEGGVPGYTYEWSNNENSDGIYNLDEGNYWVEITDALGCSQVSEVVKIVSGVDLIVDADTTHATCSTVEDGSINLNPKNGTPPYTYKWSHDDDVDDSYIDNLSPGEYSVVITDSIGCSVFQIHKVEGEPLPSPSITLSPSALCPNEPIFINVKLENIPDAVFEWDYEGDISGDYGEVLYVPNINDIDSVTCTATYNGCTSQFTRQIIPEQFPTLDLWIDRPNRQNTNNFIFEVNVGDWVHFTIPDTTILNQVDKYYWEFGDGGWSVQPQPYYYFNKWGEYDINLTITTEDGCVFEFYPIKRVGALPLREDIDSKFAAVFPNPFIDRFTLVFEAKQAGDWTVNLSNGLNQRISDTQIKAIEGTNQIPLDFSDQHLPNGLYILHISNGERHQNLKIIKNAP